MQKIIRIMIGLLLFAFFQISPAIAGQLPKLVDLGADKCIPCVKMAPILETLKEDFFGRMDVAFIDVWKNKKEAAKYNVRMIPTQIFYGADGQELYRHMGFIGREDILAQWKILGYSFDTQ
ncbi:MAG: thioredoxin family protein [Desulfuromusa sp.]|jgi:thioredoxin 1|nr:thioredoxin family protein [Desulfuromusa sp.]